MTKLKYNLALHRDRIARLEAAIQSGLPDECVIWHRADRHVQLRVGSERIGAHRFAYELFHGVKLQPDDVVCHSCDVPGCCNPKHLFVGTQGDNIRDCVAKGRHKGIPPVRHGSENGCAKLNESKITAIRSQSSAGRSYAELGRTFGVSSTMIRDIVLRKKWRNVA